MIKNQLEANHSARGHIQALQNFDFQQLAIQMMVIPLLARIEQTLNQSLLFLRNRDRIQRVRRTAQRGQEAALCRISNSLQTLSITRMSKPKRAMSLI